MINSIIIGNKSIREIIKEIRAFGKKKQKTFFHVVNLNPETYVLATEDKVFRSELNSAQAQLIDGIGIKLLAKLTNQKCGEKLAGTDLMDQLIAYANQERKKIFFLGGRNCSAQLTVKHFKKLFPKLICSSHQGSTDIKNETKNERQTVLKRLLQFKPDIIFVAYGPPYQEKWLYKNKEYLKGVVCMGVGGSFNFSSGLVSRSPKFLIKLKLEWLWRFIIEPRRTRKKIGTYLKFVLICIKQLLHL